MSLDHIFIEPEEPDLVESYVPPRSFTQHYGTPPVLGILETDRSDLSYFEKAIREKHKKIMDICSATQISDIFCYSASDVVRRIYLRAQRLSKAISNAANNDISRIDRSLLERFSRFRRAFERSISITDHATSPKAVAAVAALIMTRAEIGAPGNYEKEIQNFMLCISNRFTADFRREMDSYIKRYREALRKVLKEMRDLESELRYRGFQL